ncbi:class I SAM-dependent methyltransferase [Bradyrhizobium sp. dw_78]|uniref:class I SAM-dependent methyltransferase n=1 Tax=Bradyrhizobium sp. dw_78 TaxID=2719793 RepID=UPI001BD33BA7|nr:class I SAM-dependent methyltransferase [Bradyrhizobium sp. dw_78]
MGRFATTVPLYEEFRPPYPPEFFRTVAEGLGFTKEHALIDLGTGPGLIALGFSRYVGRIVGVDPEAAMIAAARQAAAHAKQDFTLIEGRAEALPADIGSFDVVTIGRALHWMDRDAIAALLERLVKPEGVIVVCASRSAADGRNPWLDEYNEARRFWSPGPSGSERSREALAAVLEGTRFQLIDEINVETSHELSVSDLARRVLTFSTSSPEILGDKVDAMLHDVEARLMPFSREGKLAEIVVSTAKVVC